MKPQGPERTAFRALSGLPSAAAMVNRVSGRFACTTTVVTWIHPDLARGYL
jgi:hypothetical protein